MASALGPYLDLLKVRLRELGLFVIIRMKVYFFFLLQYPAINSEPSACSAILLEQSHTRVHVQTRMRMCTVTRPPSAASCGPVTLHCGPAPLLLSQVCQTA